MELREFVDTKFIQEKSVNSNILAKIKYPASMADKKNSNNRIYPEKIWKREVERFNREIAEKKIAGQLNHPIGGNTELDKISHVVLGLEYDPATKVVSAESAILNTGSGRDLLAILDQVKLGASTRGYGTMDSKGVVQNDFRLATVDIVAKGSFGKDTEVGRENIIESGNAQFAEEVVIEEIIEGEEFLKEAYEKMRKAGNYSGTYQQFLDGFDITLTDIQDLTETAESKLIKETKRKMAVVELHEEAVKSGYREGLDEYEKMITEKDKYLKLEYEREIMDGIVTEDFESWKKRRILEEK